jgi:hypothetical protein
VYDKKTGCPTLAAFLFLPQRVENFDQISRNNPGSTPAECPRSRFWDLGNHEPQPLQLYPVTISLKSAMPEKPSSTL